MNNFFQKLLGSLAPIIWGTVVWFMGFGLGAHLISYYPVNYIIRIFITILVGIYFFGASLEKASKKYQFYWAQYSVPLPSWRYFLILVAVACCCVSMPFAKSDLIQSLLYGVIISSILEEFVAHSFFVKYAMKLEEFIVWNIISSFAFTFMHAFYQDGGSLYQTLEGGHFGFSFMLGLLVYKTQRIELAMLLHIVSNLVRYTIPVCIFHTPWPSPIAFFGSFLCDIIIILVIGFGYSKNIEYLKVKNQ